MGWGGTRGGGPPRTTSRSGSSPAPGRLRSRDDRRRGSPRGRVPGPDACRRSRSRPRRGDRCRPPGPTRCSPPRLHPREDVPELADEAPTDASPLDPRQSVLDVAGPEVEEVYERVVAEHPAEGPRVPLRVADRLRREAQREPRPLEERGSRAGRDEHLAVREATGRPAHPRRELIELPFAGRTGGPRADERRRVGGPAPDP